MLLSTEKPLSEDTTTSGLCYNGLCFLVSNRNGNSRMAEGSGGDGALRAHFSKTTLDACVNIFPTLLVGLWPIS